MDIIYSGTFKEKIIIYGKFNLNWGVIFNGKIIFQAKSLLTGDT